MALKSLAVESPRCWNSAFPGEKLCFQDEGGNASWFGKGFYGSYSPFNRFPTHGPAFSPAAPLSSEVSAVWEAEPFLPRPPALTSSAVFHPCSSAVCFHFQKFGFLPVAVFFSHWSLLNPFTAALMVFWKGVRANECSSAVFNGKRPESLTSDWGGKKKTSVVINLSGFIAFEVQQFVKSNLNKRIMLESSGLYSLHNISTLSKRGDQRQVSMNKRFAECIAKTCGFGVGRFHCPGLF